MNLRFHKRLTILPGLPLNLSKSGASVSIDHRGSWLTAGPRGRRVTVGLPGTGLFWTERLPPGRVAQARLALVVVASRRARRRGGTLVGNGGSVGRAEEEILPLAFPRA